MSGFYKVLEGSTRFWKTPKGEVLLLPALASGLAGQPKPHQAGHLGQPAVPLAVVELVEGQVFASGPQQTQVRLGQVERLLPRPALPLPRHLEQDLIINRVIYQNSNFLQNTNKLCGQVSLRITRMLF